METSTKILIGATVAVAGIAAIHLYTKSIAEAEKAAAEALAEKNRRKETRFLNSIVMSYRLDHALQYGDCPNINYALLDTIVHRELRMMQLVARNETHVAPTIKAGVTSAELVGRYGVCVELTPMKMPKS